MRPALVEPVLVSSREAEPQLRLQVPQSARPTRGSEIFRHHVRALSEELTDVAGKAKHSHDSIDEPSLVIEQIRHITGKDQRGLAVAEQRMIRPRPIQRKI